MQRFEKESRLLGTGGKGSGRVRKGDYAGPLEGFAADSRVRQVGDEVVGRRRSKRGK